MGTGEAVPSDPKFQVLDFKKEDILQALDF
jgi:hypothetical protein